MPVENLEMDRKSTWPDDPEAAEWKLRVDVAAACRAAAIYGWDDQVATHITARLPGTGHRFLINPFGTYFDEVTASSLIVLDEEGRAECGGPVNVAGFMVHSAIHNAREDARAVIHLHTNAGIAVGASRLGLRNLSPFAMLLHPLAYHDWEGVVVDATERERLAADLGSSNAMLFRNHGSLTVGATIAEAFQRSYFLQRACEIQVQAAMAADDLIEQPASMAEQVQGQTGDHFADSARLNWDAMKRRVDRINPGYAV